MDVAHAPSSTVGLRALVEAALDMPDARATAAPFVGELARPERSVRAVLLYGSCLWPSVRGASSCPDFIVIVDSLRAFFGSLWPALLGALLPPSVYRLRRGEAQAKLSVVSVAQLAAGCSATGKDLHLAGRLSKRVALVWARDAQSRALVVEARLAALRALTPLALARLGFAPADAPVGVDAFVEALLRLSYDSEVRIVEPTKVASLFAAEREHYRAVAGALLSEAHVRAAPLDELQRRLQRSRRRALLRWPKYLVTYDGWLEYLTTKLARSGSPVALSAWQRRLPLVLALPVLYRLAMARRLA